MRNRATIPSLIDGVNPPVISVSRPARLPSLPDSSRPLPRTFRRCPGFGNDCPDPESRCPGFKNRCPESKSSRPDYLNDCPGRGQRCPDHKSGCPGNLSRCPDGFQLCPDSQTVAPVLKADAPISKTPRRFHNLLPQSSLQSFFRAKAAKYAKAGQTQSFFLRHLRGLRATPFQPATFNHQP